LQSKLNTGFINVDVDLGQQLFSNIFHRKSGIDIQLELFQCSINTNLQMFECDFVNILIII